LSSDDAGTEGGGGGHRHQDAVGVVDVVAVEMLWGVVKSGSTPVGGPVKSRQKRTRAEVRGLGRG